MTDEGQSVEKIRQWTTAFLQRGFTLQYTYQKGGDSSCVYIYRFQKGKDFFDWRETSGTDELHFVVYAGGAYAFPKLPKCKRPFSLRRLLKGRTMDERRAEFAAALNAALEASEDSFFGIPL